MKKNELYTHYKGGFYSYDQIAIPIQNIKLSAEHRIEKIGTARYHENTHDIDLYQIKGIEDLTLIDFDVPCVLYRPKDVTVHELFAREVDDYFGVKIKDGVTHQRFTRQAKYE